MDPIQSKYWNDQIKSMVGPCMVTFAIPLTIPGVTITLVAFSDEKSFPLYGTLHITGLIILIISVFLIIFGCILKFIWKPIILPDIERHLSPRESFRSQRGDSFYRKEIERIQRENVSSVAAPERNRKNSCTKTEETVLGSQKGTETAKPIDVIRSGRNDYTQSEGRRVDGDERKSTAAATSNSLSALPPNDLYSQSPRGGRLPPIETTDRVGVSRSRAPSSDHDGFEKTGGSRYSDPGDTDLPRKKKKKRKRPHRREEDQGGGDEEVVISQEDGEVNEKTHKQLQLPKLQKAREHLLDGNASGESVKSSNCSLLNEEKDTSGTAKKRKKRRKKRTLSTLRQESHESQTNPIQSNRRSKSLGSSYSDDVTNRNPSDSDTAHPVDTD